MLKKLYLFYRVLQISPAIAFRKLFDIVKTGLKRNRKRLDDMEHSTFFVSLLNPETKIENSFSQLKTHNPNFKPPVFEKINISDDLFKIENSYFNIPDFEILKSKEDLIIAVTENIFRHSFNLLGSGWVNVELGCEVKGFEGFLYPPFDKFGTWNNWLKRHITPYNFEKCNRNSLFISNEYKPIDWQLDFKSGYRWDETEWSYDIKYGDVLGADIKIPWELGRMQHLIWLAYAHKLIKEKNQSHGTITEVISQNELDISNENNVYFNEFRNEILDFIASNPPRFGVQWICSMDVGIRAVNWLVAYDMFKSAGAKFDEEFEQIFAESIFEHGLHLSQNLEWSSGLSGNHYFTNIVSLLFISAYLKTNEITNTWLALALQEFINETEEQFLYDGGNFEASLPYHFYVFEMINFAIVVIMSLEKDKTTSLKNIKYLEKLIDKKINPYEQQVFKIDEDGNIIFPESFWQKFLTISQFSLYSINNLGKSFQIGDNDSGKFLKLTPPYQIESERELKSISLQHVSSLSIISGLADYNLDNAILKNIIEKEACFEYTVIRNIGKNDLYKHQMEQLRNLIADNFSVTNDDTITSNANNSFGLFLNRTNNYFTAIRCGSIGQRGKGGHAHNDNLSFCLLVVGQEIFVDPGTYLYTSIPEIRNHYRSTKMHNTLELIGKEQNDWKQNCKDDLFWMNKDKAQARVLEYSNKIFVGEHLGFGKPHKRIITFDKNFIDGVDMCDCFGTKRIHFHLAPNVEPELFDKNTILLKWDNHNLTFSSDITDIKIENYFFSPGYGEKYPSKKIILISKENKINWKIEFNNQ